MKAPMFNALLAEMTRVSNMHVYTTRTLCDCLMFGESTRAQEATIAKAVRDGVLERLAHGIYAFRRFDCRRDIRQEAAFRLRPGHHTYISCESALSSWGVITQRTLGAITLMTSGRSQRYDTPAGRIVLTHTARPYAEVLPHLVPAGDDDLLPTAMPMLAYRDLRRTGGCVDLVDMDELHDVAAEVARGI